MWIKLQSIVLNAEAATDSSVTGTDDDDITFNADDINNEDLGGEEVVGCYCNSK